MPLADDWTKTFDETAASGLFRCQRPSVRIRERRLFGANKVGPSCPASSSMPMAADTASKDSVNFASRSRISRGEAVSDLLQSMDNQRHRIVRDRWTTGRLGLAPLVRDQPAMPPQQRAGGHQPVRPRRLRQDPGQRGQQCPVVPVDPRLRVGPAQYRDLLPANKCDTAP